MSPHDAPAAPEPNTPITFGDVLRRLDWRTEALAAALILAEACPVYLFVSAIFLASSNEQTYPYWIIAMLLLVSHYVVHLLDEWRIFSPDYEIIMGGALVLSLLVAIKWASFPDIPIYDPQWLTEAARALAWFDTDAARPIWGTIILAAYAWWRSRFRDEPSLDAAYTMLRFGTLAMAIVLVINLIAADEGTEVRDRLSLATLGFFAATLIAIGLARLKLEGFRSSAPLGGRWLATFVAPIGAVVLLAIIGAGILSRQFLDTVLWLLSPVFWVLALVFQIIVLIIAVLAFLILTPVFWLIGDRQLPAFQSDATATVTGQQDPNQQPANELFQVPDPVRYLIAAIVLTLIISILIRFFFRRRLRTRPATDEERESVLDWNDLLDNAANKLRNLFRRPRNLDPLAYLRGSADWRHTLRIRELYRAFQNRGEKAGRARRDGETAEEYRPVLRGRFTPSAETAPEVDAFTQVYRRTRYSGLPASESDAEAAEAAWRSIERAKLDSQTE